jgi:hypothetical protein
MENEILRFTQDDKFAPTGANPLGKGEDQSFVYVAGAHIFFTKRFACGFILLS